METFSAQLALCAGNSPTPVNSRHKGQWRGALMFFFICVWINGWVNNREAGDLRRHHGHHDVIMHGQYDGCWCLAIQGLRASTAIVLNMIDNNLNTNYSHNYVAFVLCNKFHYDIVAWRCGLDTVLDKSITELRTIAIYVTPLRATVWRTTEGPLSLTWLNVNPNMDN